MNLKKPEIRAHRATDWSVVQQRCRVGEMPHKGFDKGGGGGEESTVKQRVQQGEKDVLRQQELGGERVCMCEGES